MIVTVLGGSAQSTPWLVRWLAEQPLSSPVTLRLAGRTPRHLHACARAARLLAGSAPLAIEEWECDSWAGALTGADVVLVQVRIGGYAGRQFDETFPLKYGIPGDEGLGPGGLASALRAWARLKGILQLIESYAPQAFPVLLTSPAGLLVRFAARALPGLPLAAICELPFTTLRDACQAAGACWRDCSFHYAGVNHLGWLYDVEAPGAGPIGPPNGRPGIPLRYARLHFSPNEVVREQLAGGSRACALEELRRSAMEAYAGGGVAEIRRALDARAAPWYTEAVGPLLLALCEAGDSRPFFFSIADAGGEVLERAYRVTNGRPVALPSAAPPAGIQEFNQRFLTFERSAERMVDSADPESVARVLEQHPWVRDPAMARALACEILDGNSCQN